MADPAFFKPLLRRISVLTVLVALPALRAQTATTGFDPNVNGTVYAVAVQADGKILIGGNFTTLKPNGATTAVKRTNIARVNADGTLDTTFDPEATGKFSNGQVTAIAVQPNGQVIIGGYFNSVQPGGTGAVVTRNHIARFNANGTLDTTFDPDAAGTLDATFDSSKPGTLLADVSAIAIQSNGQIIIGGGFTQLRPNGAASATGLNRIARLNSDGTIDASFNPNANGHVNAIAIQTDGSIVIGGAFTGIAVTTRNHVARLRATDGSADSFDPNTNGVVNAIAFEGTKVIVGGSFTTIQPNGTSTVTTQDNMARFNADGTRDPSFAPVPSATVQAIVVQPNGQVIFGGAFVNVQQNNPAGLTTATVATDPNSTVPAFVSTVVTNYVARVYGGNDSNPAGTVTMDSNAAPDFLPNPNYIVYALALQPNGQVIIGGAFTQVKPASPKASAVTAAIIRNGVARVNTDGSLDMNSDPNAAGGVGPVAIQADGSLIVGGTFTTLGGLKRGNLARVSASGVVDPTFDPEPNGSVSAIAIQPNGQIIIGGAFTTLQPNGAAAATTQSFLARLNKDGTLDTTFNPSPNAAVLCLQLEPDGRLLFGGLFTAVDATIIDYMGRLNSNGTLDTGFIPNPSGEVDAILLEPSDNAVIIGGNFTAVTPASTPTIESVGNTYLARLNNNDGTIDTGFLPQPNGQVFALALQSTGQILIGGSFTSLQPGGATTSTFTSSGALTTSNNNVYSQRFFARINSNGTLDTTGFNPNPNSPVRSIAIQPNGQILIGGYFTTLQATNGGATLPEIGLARLSATNAAVDTNFSAFPNGVVNSITVDSNAKIVIGGNFSVILPTGATTLATRYHLTRLNSDGTLDSGFNVTK